ncbi:MAG: T9SS type A sorting domain-containing protein [Candidatus Kapaibacterium sp.]
MRYGYILLSLLFSAMILHAQPENVLLSRDPLVPTLPTDIQIQSAASIGNVELVVWGSTKQNASGGIQNVLYSQIVLDNQPVGIPEIITGEDAVPYGFVEVLTVGNHFRVLWNDRRVGAVGLYQRDIDLQGTPLADEEFVAEGKGLKIYTVDLFDGATIVELSGQPPLFIYSDGRIDRRRINPFYFSSPSVIAPDSSLALIRGDSLYTYRTMFDTLPTRVVFYHREDSIVALTEVLILDSTGRYRMFFVTARAPEEFSYFDADVQFRLVSGVLSTESGELTEREEVKLNRIAIGMGASFGPNIRYYVTDKSKACDLSDKFILYAKSSQHFPSEINLEIREYTWHYTIDRKGNFAEVSKDAYEVTECSTSQQPVRTSCPTTSCVELGGVSLASPVVLEEKRVPHSQPRLHLTNGSLFIAWSNSPQVLLHSWDFIKDEVRQTASYAPDNAFKGDVKFGTIDSPQGILLGTTETRVQVIKVDFSITVDQHFWKFYLNLPVNGKWKRFASEGGDYFGGTWQSHHVRYLSSASGELENRNLLVGITDSYDTFLVTLYDSLQQVIWQRIHTSASINGGTYLTIAPLGIDKYIDVTNQGAARILTSTGDVVQTASFPEWSTTHSGLVRLRGTWSLVYHLPHDGLPLRLRIYDENLLMLARWEGEADSLTGISIAQNPNDGVIAVVTTSRSGTRMTTFDGVGLRLLQSSGGEKLDNVRLSQVESLSKTPTALFRSDTLIVAWQDYRGLDPDIYGVYLRPADYVSGVDEGRRITSDQSDLNLSVYPNPADRELFVSIEASEPVQASLRNVLGQVVYSVWDGEVTGGKTSIRLNLEQLPAGVYFLEASTTEKRASQLVIVRPLGLP